MHHDSTTPTPVRRSHLFRRATALRLRPHLVVGLLVTLLGVGALAFGQSPYLNAATVTTPPTVTTTAQPSTTTTQPTTMTPTTSTATQPTVTAMTPTTQPATNLGTDTTLTVPVGADAIVHDHLRADGIICTVVVSKAGAVALACPTEAYTTPATVH
jgi:Predicted solute binding protein